MIRGSRLEFSREFRASGKRKLIGMHAQTQSMTTRGRQYLPRLVGREYTFFAKNVAVLSQLFFRDARQHFIYDQVDITCPSRFVFRGNVVSTEKGRNVAQWRFSIQLLDGPQDLQLVFNRQPVTGFCFDGRAATPEKPLRVTLTGFDQVTQRRRARGPDRRSDASAARGNLTIRRAARALFEFVHPDAGKDRMGVRVYKARHNDAALGIDDLAIVLNEALDLAASANGFDQIAAHQHRAVLDNRQLTQIAAGTWPPGSGERY